MTTGCIQAHARSGVSMIVSAGRVEVNELLVGLQ